MSGLRFAPALLLLVAGCLGFPCNTDVEGLTVVPGYRDDLPTTFGPNSTVSVEAAAGDPFGAVVNGVRVGHGLALASAEFDLGEGRADVQRDDAGRITSWTVVHQVLAYANGTVTGLVSTEMDLADLEAHVSRFLQDLTRLSASQVHPAVERVMEARVDDDGETRMAAPLELPVAAEQLVAAVFSQGLAVAVPPVHDRLSYGAGQISEMLRAFEQEADGWTLSVSVAVTSIRGSSLVEVSALDWVYAAHDRVGDDLTLKQQSAALRAAFTMHGLEPPTFPEGSWAGREYCH